MAVSMVDRAREEVRCRKLHSIKANITEVTLINVKRYQSVTVSLGRRRHRFTRATVIAAAVFNVFSFNVPFSIRHLLPLCMNRYFPNNPPSGFETLVSPPIESLIQINLLVIFAQ
jgi:hypothetical protein